MPRGSAPGERRGGRKRGTPNKRTELKRLLGEVLKEDDSKALIGEIVKTEAPPVPRNKRKGVEYMSDILPAIWSVVAKYQNEVVRLQRDPSAEDQSLGSLDVVEEKFNKFTQLMLATASALAKYESPTYRALFLQQEMPAPVAPEQTTVQMLEAQAVRDPTAATQTYLRLIKAPKAA